MTIDVYIDRLVLDVLDRRDGRHITAAIERGLADLVHAGGLPNAGDTASVERLDAGTVRTTPAGRSRQIGGHIARAVYRGAGG